MSSAARSHTDTSGSAVIARRRNSANLEYVCSPVYRIRRDGVTRVVRTSRYALAVALGGEFLAPDVMALHECDNPVCARVLGVSDALLGVPAHVVGGDQRQNMVRMARMRRGGGRRPI